MFYIKLLFALYLVSLIRNKGGGEYGGGEMAKQKMVKWQSRAEAE
jgi:hypothetical protein